MEMENNKCKKITSAILLFYKFIYGGFILYGLWYYIINNTGMLFDEKNPVLKIYEIEKK